MASTMSMTWLLLTFATLRTVEARCTRTRNGDGYPLIIGVLSPGVNDQRLSNIIQKSLLLTGDTSSCFQVPKFLTLFINATLMMPQHGWAKIESGIEEAMTAIGAQGQKPTLIIGPFYVNLAMVLQRLEIPYLVTDYKGFDWIDMNKVQDTINWATTVEIRPSAQAQNLAVVDYFLYRKWTNAMMIMPESAADNQECQDLASQMLKHSLSVIPYAVDPQDPTFTDLLREFLRNAKLYLLTQIIVCSPRDSRDTLIEAVLTQAKPFDILQNKEYSFVLVDPSSELIPLSGAGNMYRLGLFSARCQLLAFRYVIPSSEDIRPPTEEDAAASDATSVVSYTLSRYIMSQTVVTDEFSVDRFLKALKTVKLLDGKTGNIEFDELGHRTNYTLHLYDHGGEDMYKQVTSFLF